MKKLLLAALLFFVAPFARAVNNDNVTMTISLTTSLSILIPETTLTFGSLVIGGSGRLEEESLRVSNNSGGLIEDFQVSATIFYNGVNSWAYSQDLTPATDEVLLAMVALSMGTLGLPAIVESDFDVEDIVSNQGKPMNATNFQQESLAGASTKDDGKDVDAFGVYSEISVRFWMQLPSDATFEVTSPTSTLTFTALVNSSF